MNGASLTQYSQRLDRIEIVIWLIAAVLAAIVVLLVTTVRAFRRRIVLRDKKGAARLAVGMSGSEEPEITFSDRAERVRMSIAVGEVGPTITLLDENGKPRLGIGFIPGGVISVVLRGPDGTSSLDMSFHESGGPYVAVFDSEGKQRIGGGMSLTGEPALVFFGRDGRERVQIGFGPDGEPLLKSVEEEGGTNGRPPWGNGTGGI